MQKTERKGDTGLSQNVADTTSQPLPPPIANTIFIHVVAELRCYTTCLFWALIIFTIDHNKDDYNDDETRVMMIFTMVMLVPEHFLQETTATFSISTHELGQTQPQRVKR